MERAKHNIYAQRSRVSTIFNVDVGTDCAENFCIEIIDTDDTTEIWLYFDAQGGFIYPKELMIKVPKGIDKDLIEELIVANADRWEKSYGDMYLKDEWNY